MLDRITEPLLTLVPGEVRRAANPWALGASIVGGMRVDVPDDLGTVTAIDAAAEVDPASVDVRPGAVGAIWRSLQNTYRTGFHPGISLVLRRRGRVLVSRALGHATGYALEDEEPEVPMTPRTPLCIYSGSKAMTAVLVHRLAEDGLVDLDAPVTRWIPDFGQRGKGGITVRHLLTHRAGISRMPMKIGDDVDRMLDHDTMLARLCASPADTRPGASQAYHAVTAGFVLGEIATRAADKPLRELLRTMLAEPLGAWSLTYGYPDQSPHTPARSAATGPVSIPGVSYLVDRLLGMPAALVTPTLEGSVGRQAVVPAGNIYASAEEGSRFMQMLLDGGSWDGHRILRRETVAAAVAPAGRLVIDGSFPAPVRFTPGFMLGEVGVSLFGVQAPAAYGHLGFTNILLWADPERELSAALCTTGKSVHPVALGAFATMVATISTTIPRSARV